MPNGMSKRDFTIRLEKDNAHNVDSTAQRQLEHACCCLLVVSKLKDLYNIEQYFEYCGDNMALQLQIRVFYLHKY